MVYYLSLRNNFDCLFYSHIIDCRRRRRRKRWYLSASMRSFELLVDGSLDNVFSSNCSRPQEAPSSSCNLMAKRYHHFLLLFLQFEKWGGSRRLKLFQKVGRVQHRCLLLLLQFGMEEEVVNQDSFKGLGEYIIVFFLLLLQSRI